MNFKNTSNVWYTQGLFIETTTDASSAIYTLQEEDNEYPSLRKLYIETSDPTEYAFACKYLGGWDHWQTLASAAFFQKYVSLWRNELEVKLRSEAVAKIQTLAQTSPRDAFQANKYLADRGYDSPRQTKGRPKKEDIARAASAIAADNKRESTDYLRIVSN